MVTGQFAVIAGVNDQRVIILTTVVQSFDECPDMAVKERTESEVACFSNLARFGIKKIIIVEVIAHCLEDRVVAEF